jgi:hypothetical protein
MLYLSSLPPGHPARRVFSDRRAAGDMSAFQR